MHQAQANRINTIKKNYDNSLKILKDRFDSELEKLKNGFLNSKKQIFGLDEDQFRDRIELKTRLLDQPKYVELEVYVPKAQAANLFTTVDKREIKVNLTRNHSDSFKDEDERTEFKKKQSVTKLLQTNDILSERNISKVILEDKTIFKIPKA